ncbi:unnamed protein product, partial [Meganyctiphanes norvegica]
RFQVFRQSRVEQTQLVQNPKNKRTYSFHWQPVPNIKTITRKVKEAHLGSSFYFQTKKSNHPPTESYHEVKQKILQLYPELAEVPFILAKMDMASKLYHITPPPQTAKDIKKYVLPKGGGHRSKIYIITK